MFGSELHCFKSVWFLVRLWGHEDWPGTSCDGELLNADKPEWSHLSQSKTSPGFSHTLCPWMVNWKVSIRGVMLLPNLFESPLAKQCQYMAWPSTWRWKILIVVPCVSQIIKCVVKKKKKKALLINHALVDRSSFSLLANSQYDGNGFTKSSGRFFLCSFCHTVMLT